MKNQYRIKESCGRYTIQIYGYDETGILWWKKKKWNWFKTNPWGGVRQIYPILQPASKKFKSLEKAKKQIKCWESKPIYHIIN